MAYYLVTYKNGEFDIIKNRKNRSLLASSNVYGDTLPYPMYSRGTWEKIAPDQLPLYLHLPYKTVLFEQVLKGGCK